MPKTRGQRERQWSRFESWSSLISQLWPASSRTQKWERKYLLNWLGAIRSPIPLSIGPSHKRTDNIFSPHSTMMMQKCIFYYNQTKNKRQFLFPSHYFIHFYHENTHAHWLSFIFVCLTIRLRADNPVEAFLSALFLVSVWANHVVTKNRLIKNQTTRKWGEIERSKGELSNHSKHTSHNMNFFL